MINRSKSPTRCKRLELEEQLRSIARRLCAMPEDEITVSMTCKQLFDLASAIQVSTSAGYGSDSITVSFSSQQFHDLGGQLRLACNTLAEIGQEDMAARIAELLAYVERWPSASAQADSPS
jgi:hypothetical protein